MKKYLLISLFTGVFVLIMIVSASATDLPTMNQSNSLPEVTQTPPIILADTPVYLKIRQSVTSGAIPVSTEIKYQVIREVKSPEGKIMIPYHADAYGTLIGSLKRKLTQPGEIVISLDRVIGSGNKIISVQRRQEARGGSHFFFFGIGFMMVAEDVTITENTPVKAFVTNDTVVKKPDVEVNKEIPGIQIETPCNNDVFKKGTPINLFCNVHPSRNIDYVRFLFNEKVVFEQKGEQPEIVTINDNSIRRGNYKITAEVRFLSGEFCRSDAVLISVK